jgi:transcriptional regulator with XRE-family HTH domain
MDCLLPGGDSLSRTLGSPRHRALVELVIRERKAADLTQVQVATKLSRYQSYVALLETGQRRLDVVEFMDIADAIGFDAPAAMAASTSSHARRNSLRRSNGFQSLLAIE